MTQSFDGADLMDPRTHSEDPWPFYSWLLEERPLYFDESNQLWAVSRYEDVMRVARDWETFTSEEGNLPLMPPDSSLMHMNGPGHAKRRGLLSRGFTPRQVSTLEDKAGAISGKLIDAVAAAGECDVVHSLAKLLPMQIIAEMIGYPPEDYDRVLAWIDLFMVGGSGPKVLEADPSITMQFADFAVYHAKLVEQRKDNPGDDLLSMWIEAEIDGEKLRDDQIFFDHAVILGGGSETTRHAISDGVYELIRHPDQRQYLVDNPEAMPAAVDEIIRWSSPFVRMARTARRDVELHGQTIKAGQEVLMLYPAACRDPRAYDDPNRFDVRRQTDKHAIAFGYGQHFCLGSNLAKVEARVMIGEIIRRLPNMRLAPGKQIARSNSSFVRGLESLPVVFDVEVDAPARSRAE